MTVTTAPATPSSDQAEPPEPPPPAADAGLREVVAAGRARIDELDDDIIALVRQRLEVSRGIQRARLAAGGRRVEHGREVDIVNRYAAALGRPGADVALALLTLARGSALSSVPPA
jgi:chorismate mutase